MNQNASLLELDLQTLSTESRRKHPEIREGTDRSLTLLRSVRKGSESIFHSTLATDEFLSPLLQGCSSKNAKLITICITCLQRIVTLRIVPESSINQLITILHDLSNQSVEIQLKILQLVLPLITNYTFIRDQLLSESILLCFRLQDSKIAVVSSTAAATLRQIVILVFDRVAKDGDQDNTAIALEGITLPSGVEAAVLPSLKDAFHIFQDLCLLTAGESAILLSKLRVIPKTLGLELIESILSNHSVLFLIHDELQALLKQCLCPLLIRSFTDHTDFPTYMRAMRVIYLIIKQFSKQLFMESEIFLSICLKNLEPDQPLWHRALCMEVFRGLCLDPNLLLTLFERVDRNEQASDVFRDMVTSFQRLGSEKPALLGSVPLSGVALPSSRRESMDFGSVAGLLSSAASAAASATAGAVNFRAEEPSQWSASNSSLRVQCIDQLDKAEPPQIPDTYIYYLSFLCITSICDGLLKLVPQNLTIVDGNPVEFTALIVREMAEVAWPALLASLSFFIGTNMDDELFGIGMNSFQSFSTVCGKLGAVTPRDTFLTSLSKLAIPSNVLKKLTSKDTGGASHSSAGVLSKVVGLTVDVNETNAINISDRNIRSLQVLINLAQVLGDTLGESWYIILETLQSADFVLRRIVYRVSRSPHGTPVRKRSTADQQKIEFVESREADIEVVFQQSVAALFESTKGLNPMALMEFYNALCRLSSETILGMPADKVVTTNEENIPVFKSMSKHQRRGSGILSSRVSRFDGRAFTVEKLHFVSILNLERLTTSEILLPVWKLVTSHLVLIATTDVVSTTVKYQVADSLSNMILDAAPLILATSSTHHSRMQVELLTSLKGIIETKGISSSSDALVARCEIQRRGLQTLHDLLERNGHSINVGWALIFDMIRIATDPPPNPTTVSVTSEEVSVITEEQTPTSPYAESLNAAAPVNNATRKSGIVRAAFSSLQLICTDFLSSLEIQCLRSCIEALGAFGLLQEDMNASFTSVGLLWNVSDFVQSGSRALSTEECTALWMLILQQLLSICYDIRAEVRNGAVQTIFRTLDLNGSKLSLETWHQCLWDILFPLIEVCNNKLAQQYEQQRLLKEEQSGITTTQLETPSQRIAANSAPRQWDDTQAIVLSGVASNFQNFLLEKLIDLEDIEEAWKLLLSKLECVSTSSGPNLCLSTFKCFATLFNSIQKLPAEQAKLQKVQRMWNFAFLMWEAVGKTMSTSSAPDVRFTQDSLTSFIDSFVPLLRILRFTLSEDYVSRILNVFRGIITYSKSPQYSPDIDSLSPLQKAVLDLVDPIDQGVSGSIHGLVLTFLSELITLAYVASFESEPAAVPGLGGKEKSCYVSYVAMSKAATEKAITIYSRHSEDLNIYTSGAFEKTLGALSVPMKLKYDCPAANKYGDDQDLWITATNHFLHIVREGLSWIDRNEDLLSKDVFQSICLHLALAFKDALLADNSLAIHLDLAVREEHELLSMNLLTLFSNDIIGFLSKNTVDDTIINIFARTMFEASTLYSFKTLSPPARNGDIGLDGRKVELSFDRIEDAETRIGNVAEIVPSVQETMSFACLDALFWMSSSSNDGNPATSPRVARHTAPLLLKRCKSVIVTYTADLQLQGNMPLQRIREQELKVILSKMNEIDLVEGCIADIDDTNSIRKACVSGKKAHLFYLLTPLARALPIIAYQNALSVHGNKEEGSIPVLLERCFETIAGEIGVP